MRDTIDMARKAGIRDCTCSGSMGCLKHFEALARADQREIDAQVCDELHYEADAYGAQCAEAIRARGQA